MRPRLSQASQVVITMNHTQAFAALRSAVSVDPTEKSKSSQQVHGSIMLAIMKLKEATQDVVLESIKSRDACELAKTREASLQLRQENLLFKRAHLLSEIETTKIFPTKSSDAIQKETGKALASKTYLPNMGIKKKHEAVLKLLLEEHLNRKKDKLALEQKKAAQANLLTELDTKRKFIDEELHQHIAVIDSAVQSVAKGFQEDTEENIKIEVEEQDQEEEQEQGQEKRQLKRKKEDTEEDQELEQGAEEEGQKEEEEVAEEKTASKGRNSKRGGGKKFPPGRR